MSAGGRQPEALLEPPVALARAPVPFVVVGVTIADEVVPEFLRLYAARLREQAREP